MHQSGKCATSNCSGIAQIFLHFIVLFAMNVSACVCVTICIQTMLRTTEIFTEFPSVNMHTVTYIREL